jgi:hypothetical protein
LACPARIGIAITRSDQLPDLLGRQAPRHVGKLPMGVGRNGVVETRLTAAFDCELSQERPQARRAAARKLRTAVARL